MLSLSLPPDDNVLSLGSFVLDTIGTMIGVLLYVIKSFVLPSLAVSVSNFVYGSGSVPPRVPGLLMMSTMLVVVAFAPFVTVLLINQNCFALWLQLWLPCQSGSSFDTHLDATVGSYSFTSTFIPSLWAEKGENVCALFASCTTTADIIVNTSITTNANICTPSYRGDGSCPRSLISALGDIYTKELIARHSYSLPPLLLLFWMPCTMPYHALCLASISLSPPLSILRATPHMQRLKAWWSRRVLCRHGESKSGSSMDRFVFGVVINAELPVMLGFCVPALFALSSFAIFLNAGVLAIVTRYFQIEISVKSPVEIPAGYLWISLGMGAGIVLWCPHPPL